MASDILKFDHPVASRKGETEDESQKETFNEFVRWLRENGAKFPDLYFKCYSRDVRGVHTRRRIPPYQQIIAIPLKCIITDQTGRNTPLGRRLEAVSHKLTVPNHCQVIVYMMTTRKTGNRSFYAPYYKTLPYSFDNFPIFWTPDELKKLEGSDLVRQIKDRKRNIRNDYEIIRETLGRDFEFTFEDFLWCRTAVGSRNFSIVVDGEKRTAMVPMADMLNHYRPRQTSWTFDNSQGCFTMTSLKMLGPRVQVMDSYGKKCNSKFLLHYGFTIECNREADGKCQNEVDLICRLVGTSKEIEKKSYFVGKSRRCRLTMNHEDRGTSETLAYLRVAVATDSELRYCSRGLRRTFFSSSFVFFSLCVSLTTHVRHIHMKTGTVISARNEAAAIAALKNFARDKLSRYPTKMEEDEKKLQNRDLDPFGNEKHILIVLRGEKEILHFYMNFADEIIPLLALPPPERSIKVRKKYDDCTDIARYITSVDRALSRRGL